MTDKGTPVLGRVTSVFNKNGRVYVTAQHPRPGVTDEEIPFMSLTPGAMVTPAEGDIVEIYQLDSGGAAARFAHNSPGFDMPDLGENEMVFKFDSQTEIRVQQEASGSYNINISASGDVTVGDAANAESLAVQNHTHPESGGGTTGSPNEDGTATNVE